MKPACRPRHMCAHRGALAARPARQARSVESRARSRRSPDRRSTREAHTACRPAIRGTAARPGNLADDARAASAHAADATGTRPERSRNDGHHVTGLQGVGKTHLAVALGLKASEQGIRVLFTTATGLIVTLGKAFAEGRARRAPQDPRAAAALDHRRDRLHPDRLSRRQHLLPVGLAAA